MSAYLKLLNLKRYIPTPFKEFGKQILLTIRAQNGHNRATPNFIIIGVQKGGTTSLFTYLMQHPQILPPLHKQTFYFDRHFQKSINYYKASFPLMSDLKQKEIELNEPILTGEATPDYIYFPEVPERIKNHNLSPKFIIIYREPLARSISEYNYLPIYYTQQLSIDEYFQKELAAFQSVVTLSSSWSSVMKSANQFPILSRGLYNLQLKHWLQYFPKNQFLCISNEALKTNQKSTLNTVANFLGIDQFTSVNNEVYNKTKRKKDIPSNSVQADIQDAFAPHYKEFLKLIQP